MRSAVRGLPLGADVGSHGAERRRELAEPAVLARGRGVDADHDLAQARGDGGGGVLDVHLEARTPDERALHEPRAEVEVLGGPGGEARAADAVDVGEGQSGVGERLLDHGRLEHPAARVELAGRRHRVGDADDRRLTSQRSASHRAPRVVRARMRFSSSGVGNYGECTQGSLDAGPGRTRTLWR